MNVAMRVKKLFHNNDNKNLFNNILFAFIIKGISLCISVFSMPMYIKYFDNDEALGLWYTLLSVISWILICDLGLGNGLRNKLTEALVLKDVPLCRKMISSTYGMLIVIILPVSIIGSILISSFDLNQFFNISEHVISNETLCKAFVILFVGICVNFILKTINSIIYAIQKSSVNNFLSLITSVIPLVYIAIFKGDNIESNLISLSYVHVFAVNIPLLVSTVIMFSRKELKQCKPSFKYADKSIAKTMFSLGMNFFIVQVLFMLLTHTNEIIITKLYSSADVVEYSVYYKLFTMAGSLFMLALTPLWSKVTKDLTEKKYGTLIKTNNVLLIISALAAVVEFTVIPFLQFGVNIWLRDEAITVHIGTALIFAFYGSVYILNVVLTTIANGIGKLKTQMVFYGIGVLFKIPTVLILKKIVGNWDTVMLYNGIVLLVFSVFQYFWINHWLVKLQKENE